MRQVGSVEIPQKAFASVLEAGMIQYEKELDYICTSHSAFGNVHTVIFVFFRQKKKSGNNMSTA